MSRKNKIIEFLFTIPLVNWLIRRSKTTTLPGFTGIPIYQVVAFFIRQVQTIGMVLDLVVTGMITNHSFSL